MSVCHGHSCSAWDCVTFHRYFSRERLLLRATRGNWRDHAVISIIVSTQGVIVFELCLFQRVLWIKPRPPWMFCLRLSMENRCRKFEFIVRILYRFRWISSHHGFNSFFNSRGYFSRVWELLFSEFLANRNTISRTFCLLSNLQEKGYLSRFTFLFQLFNGTSVISAFAFIIKAFCYAYFNIIWIKQSLNVKMAGHPV